MPTLDVTRRAVAVLGAAVALGARPRAAAAHAFLVRAEPPPGLVDALPARLLLGFSGPLDRGSWLRLLDVDGRDVPGIAGGIDPEDRTCLEAWLPGCPPGAYTAAWGAVSAEDGHPATGFHGLLVGGASPPVAGAAPEVVDGAVTDLELAVVPVASADGGVSWIVRAAGPTAEAVQRVLLTFVPPLPDIGVTQVQCRPDDAGGMSASFLPTMVGEWHVVATVRRAGVTDDVRQRFRWNAVAPVA